MGRIRIYKVAELLDITSQEVLSLLKRNHGIELKSASSTIEEVVARQFVNREAKSRKIAQPTGDMFAAKESAPKNKRASKAKKKTEPPKKPDKPSLGPPRLVKTIKPAPPPTEATETPEEITTSVEAAVAPHEEPVTTTSDPEDTAPGRVAPSTIRLRIEEPGSPVRPAARTKRAAVLKKRRTQKQATPTQTPKAEKLKTTSPTKSRPSSRGLPPRPRPTTPSMMGGPRPYLRNLSEHNNHKDRHRGAQACRRDLCFNGHAPFREERERVPRHRQCQLALRLLHLSVVRSHSQKV